MEKKNNKPLIIILVIVLLILVVFGALYATGIIKFKGNTVDNNSSEIKTRDPADDSKINIDDYADSAPMYLNKEALRIVEEVFTSKEVQYLINGISVTYCNSSILSESELGLNYQWNGYYKCDDFHSYQELINNFKKYTSETFFNELLLSERYLRDKNTMEDGTVMYNYYEKDGNLYAANTGKGSDVNKYKFLKDETTYKIEKFDNGEISAIIDAKWETANGDKYAEKEKITLVGEDSSWKINAYESELVSN